MKKVALAICVASALFATEKNTFELTPVIGYAHSEGTKGIDDEKFVGIRFGFNLDTPVLSQIELGYDYSPHVSYEHVNNVPVGYKTNINRYYANLVKEFGLTDWLGLYGLLGVGYQDLNRELEERPDIEDGGFAQAGLGFKFHVTDNFALKLEARDLLDFDHGDNTFMYSLGFAVGFGGEKEVVKEVTPEPVAIAPQVQEIGDEDGDGVLDNVDRCPGTPKGVVVDEYGCEKVIVLNLRANFAFNSSNITPEYESKIKEVADILVEHKEYRVVLEGNTDSVGSAEYNKKLSLKRANAVADVLNRQGVDRSRISTIGLGEDNPVASNATKEGRAQNRRVDAKFRK